MKKFLALAFILLLPSVAAIAQQKALKPTVMIMPSKAYCFRHQYGQTMIDSDGREAFIVDYQKALLDENLRLIITGTEQFFQKNGFPLANLGATLDKMDQSGALKSVSGSDVSATDLIIGSAKPDIYIDLDFTVARRGPQKQVQKLNLEARDAASTELIYGKIGDSSMSASASLTVLCQEVVNSYADEFLSELTEYFTEMFAKGRKIEVVFIMGGQSPYKFNDTIELNGKDYDLYQLIERQIRKLAKDSNYNITTNTSTELRFQMRCPIFREEEDPFDGTTTTVAVSAANIGQDLRAFLNNRKFFPFRDEQINIRVTPQGLGIVNIIIGGE